MIPDSVRAVFFDAAHTLLVPTPPVPEVYLEEALKLGVTLDAERFRTRLADCWERLRATPADTENLAASDAIETARWHRFTAEVASPFPELAAHHEDWLALLVRHFDAPEAWRPFPGVLELLDRLRATGRICAVVSNWHSALHGILEELGVRRRVDFVLASVDAGWRKPHPGIFVAALDRAGVSPRQAMHVGDSLAEDVLGATACGITAVLVSPKPARKELPPGCRRIGNTARLDTEISDQRAPVFP